MRRLIYLFFFLSGFCGLIYEVLWTRLFVLVMGGTVYSFTTVLVAFMSGLALGGFWGGKYADRMKSSPLLVYGILEGLIGIYCLLIPTLINLLNPIFDRLYPFLSGHNLAGLLVRFFFSGLILLIPCLMMGATLPILVRFQYGEREHFGKTTGLLYGINTLGAVFGSFVSGMVLIPELGQRNTLYFSAGLNLLIFASILTWRLRRSSEFGLRRAELGSLELPASHNLRSVLVLVGYGLSGCVAMIYQVIWTRVLILSLGTTLYVLSLILTAYIAGLALGTFVITPFVDRLKRLLFWIGFFEFGIGISAWLVVPSFARLPLWMVFVHRPESYWSWFGIEFLIGFGLIFVPTFLMGCLLPVVVRVYGELRGGIGEAVGGVYAWNTIGAILGSFICGFFLISWLGLRDSLILGCILSLLVGLVFILLEQMRVMIKLSMIVPVLLVGSVLFHFQPGWDPEVINSGAYIYFKDYLAQGVENQKRLRESLKSMATTLFHKEGVEATVSVFETRDHTLALRINGKTDASSGTDMTTQVLTGHLALLLHPAPKKIAVIGLASGVTLGSALTHPIEEAVCLEISPEVVEASRYFNSLNRRPLLDPRTRLVIDDGRYFLKHTRESFDAIISEPSNPWISGMGLLFTEEFFQLARTKLNPGGIILIWIGVYDLDLDAVQMIVRTFLKVFPQATMWEAIPGGDYLLVGFKDRVWLDYSSVKARMEDSMISSDLSRINLELPEKLLARFLMGPKELKNFAGAGPIHSDDRRQLELTIPKLRYLQTSEKNLVPILQAFLQHRRSPEEYLFSASGDMGAIGELTRFYQARQWMMEAYLAIARKEDRGEVLAKLKNAEQIDPQDRWVKENLYLAYFFQGQQELRQKKFPEAVKSLSQAWEYNRKGWEIPVFASFYYLEVGELGRAEEWLSQAFLQTQVDALAWMLRGELELKQGKPELAISSLQRAQKYWLNQEKLKEKSIILKSIWEASRVNLTARLFSDLGEVHFQLGNFKQAQSDFEQALSFAPEYDLAWLGLGRTNLELGELGLARERLSRAVKLSPKNALGHFYLAQALAQMPEQRQEAIVEFQTFLKLADPEMPERAEAEKQLSQLTKNAQ